MPTTPGALARALTARLRNLKVSASASHRSAVRPKQVSAEEFERRSMRQAAVLVPLCAVYGHLCLLFTLRSRDVGSHKGHVSFPGGHVDGAESPREAAVRELIEEVGADLQLAAQDVAVLGSTPPVQAVTGTMVTPVLGLVGAPRAPLRTPLALEAGLAGGWERDLGTILDRQGAAQTRGIWQPSCPEVERVFTLRVSDLMLPEHRTLQDLGYRGEVASYRVGAAPTIWGLTGFILDEMLHSVVAPALDDIGAGTNVYH